VTKEDLLSILDYAIEREKGIHVFISMPNLPKHEMIANPKENVAEKRKYYDEAYDDDCCLKAEPKIRIVSVVTY
jgi:hypothetical protein